jgi:hypothetical protein
MSERETTPRIQLGRFYKTRDGYVVRVAPGSFGQFHAEFEPPIYDGRWGGGMDNVVIVNSEGRHFFDPDSAPYLVREISAEEAARGHERRAWEPKS